MAKVKRASAVILVLLLLLGSVPFVAQPGAASDGEELEEAPKRVTVAKAPLVFDGHGRGFIPPPMDLSYLTGRRMPSERVSPRGVSQPPASFDWRTEGKVTSVKNQGACGSCYAFAAIANFESKMLIDGRATLPDPDYSENNAKECNYWETNNIDGGTSCSGGWYSQVANLFSKKGTVLESCDPYVASDVACKGTCPYQVTLLDWRIICGGVVPDTDVLKTYIETYGPVFTTLYSSFPGFSSYDGTYTLYYAGTEQLDHAVLIVGWDDSLSHAGGTGGWIVKNSWGTGWGNGGYFTIAYESASIGMYSSFLYDWQDYDEQGDLYYYDECGWTTAWGQTGGLNTTCWGLCKFTPTDDAPVERVEFWTTDITTDVDVYLYDDFDGTNLSNQLASKLNSSFSEAGYHSVEFDTPVPMSAGDDVIAVVKFTNSSWGYPLAADNKGPSETNRTYISLAGPGGVWTDLGLLSEDDVCIRLRTPTLPPSVTTNAATLVGATTATLNGIITDDGGEACQHRFEYDIDSGEPYDYNTGWTGSETTGQSFSANITGLSGGTTYYFRAQARNSAGTSSGSELTFMTTAEIISISLLTDGSVELGMAELGETADSLGDVQTVKVDTGPADLNIKSTVFSDGTGNTWALGTTNGDNQVIWKFSPDGSSWNIFEVADTEYPLASNVAENTTQDLYFRLTMPTSSSSEEEFSATVTILATVP